MSSHQKTCDICGDTSITDSWEPIECVFCELDKQKSRALSAESQANKLKSANDILQQNIHDLQDANNKLQVRLVAVIGERDLLQKGLDDNEEAIEEICSLWVEKSAEFSRLDVKFWDRAIKLKFAKYKIDELQSRIDTAEKQKPVSVDVHVVHQKEGVLWGMLVKTSKGLLLDSPKLYSLPVDQSAEIERLRAALERTAKYPQTPDDELGYDGCRRIAKEVLNDKRNAVDEVFGLELEK